MPAAASDATAADAKLAPSAADAPASADAPGSTGGAPPNGTLPDAVAPPPSLAAVSTLKPEPPRPKVYAVGARVSALATFDQTYHPADVVDVRRPANASDDALEPADVSYYVRYVGFDKRLDEWIPGTNVEPYTAAVGEENGPGAVDPALGGVGVPRGDPLSGTLAPTRAPGESSPAISSGGTTRSTTWRAIPKTSRRSIRNSSTNTTSARR